MVYVDGYVLITKNLKAYSKMARDGANIWKKNGALEYFECVGEDLNPKTHEEMSMLGFPKMIKQKKGEYVIFAFIVYKSKSHRNVVNKKVMTEMSKLMTPEDMKKCNAIMDMKRFAYGGFKVIVKK